MGGVAVMVYLSEPLVKEWPVGGHPTKDLHKSCDILPMDTKVIIEPSHLVVKILEGAGSAGARQISTSL